MRLNRIVLTAVALTLAASTAVEAAPARRPAPKPICQIMVDNEKNDGNWNVVPLVQSPMVDIISGDVATSKNELVAVLRLASTSETGDNWTRLGYNWAFGSNAGGTSYAFRARRTGSGVWEHGVQVGDTYPPYKFVINHATKSFEWHVERKNVKQMNRPGLVWTKFSANTAIFSSTADSADANTARYPDKHPSCVKTK